MIMEFSNEVIAANTEQNTITFDIFDTDYKLNRTLMRLFAQALDTTNIYTIQNDFYDDDKELTLFTVDCKIDYITDKDNWELSKLVFKSETDDTKRQFIKLLDRAVTKENFERLETAMANKLNTNVFFDHEYWKYQSVDSVLYKHMDYICSRQTLIKLFDHLGYKDAVRKATRYISKNDIQTLRFSHLHRYKIDLKNAMKAV